MSRHILMTAGVLVCLTLAAAAQAPAPDAMSAARSLVTTMKLGDQYKALLPVILLNLKPTVVQGRPEIERDYDAMTAMIAATYTPFYNEMLESAAAVYAANFTTDEMRQMEASTACRSDRSCSNDRKGLRSKPRRSVRTSAAKPPTRSSSA